MNDVQHRVPAQSAARVCARAHLAYAHEHSIIHYPAGCRRVPHSVPCSVRMRTGAARPAYARKQARDTGRATRVARGTGAQFSSMPAMSSVHGSGLGKIGQGVNRGS